jgi:hypothetical protein
VSQSADRALQCAPTPLRPAAATPAPMAAPEPTEAARVARGAATPVPLARVACGLPPHLALIARARGGAWAVSRPRGRGSAASDARGDGRLAPRRQRSLRRLHRLNRGTPPDLPRGAAGRDTCAARSVAGEIPVATRSARRRREISDAIRGAAQDPAPFGQTHGSGPGGYREDAGRERGAPSPPARGARRLAARRAPCPGMGVAP